MSPLLNGESLTRVGLSVLLGTLTIPTCGCFTGEKIGAFCLVFPLSASFAQSFGWFKGARESPSPFGNPMSDQHFRREACDDRSLKTVSTSGVFLRWHASF